MRRPVVCAALLLAACASQPGVGPEYDAARRAFADLQAAVEEMRVRIVRTGGGDPSFETGIAESGRRIDGVRERFLDAFAATDWAAWPPGADDRLVALALPATGRRALERGDAPAAVRAYELTAARLFPANTAVSVDLPYAMFVAGDTDGAVARAETFARQMKPGHVSPVENLLGDFACLSGDVATARRWYERAAAHDPGC